MLTYFLQVNVCWLLFYGVYYALLSKETFFKLNRIWLISSLLCGLVLPFAADYFAVKIEPTHLFALTLEPFVVTAKTLQQNLAADTEGVVLKTITVIYGLGLAVLTARFVAGLLSIFKILKQAKIEQQDGFKLAFTEGGVPPFSFFNYIFINPNEFENYDFQQIMHHEKAHVQQRHSYDVVFLEILNIVFWCSPCIYFYKTSLRNVHEYLADEAVLLKNAKAEYGRLLLRQRQSGMALSLTSNISNHFFSQLKKRILMMTRNKSKRTALIKYALAAPIFLILTAALASPKTPILAKTEALSDKVVRTIDKIEKENLNSLLPQINDNQGIMDNSASKMKEGEIMVYLDNLKSEGLISETEIHNAKELKAIQIINGEKVECTITGFTLVVVKRREDPMQANVTGSKINADAKSLLEKVKTGDFIQFLNIKALTDGLQKPRGIGSISFYINATPQYSTTSDTTFKPLSDLKLVDEKQIAQMNVDTKEEFNTQITITFKDGHVERYKGSKADMEKIFKKENVDAAKLEAEEKATIQMKQKLDDEQKAKIQNKEKSDITTFSGIVLNDVDEKPEFPQGTPALFRWLGENIKYPKSARDAGGQGTVYVGFIVETDGSITNVNIKRDAPVIVRDTITLIESNGVKGNKIVERTEYSLGKEAVRVISMMPNWKPGKKDGKIVRVSYTLPIKFKLD